jgi:hypothetical protein
MNSKGPWLTPAKRRRLISSDDAVAANKVNVLTLRKNVAAIDKCDPVKVSARYSRLRVNGCMQRCQISRLAYTARYNKSLMHSGLINLTLLQKARGNSNSAARTSFVYKRFSRVEKIDITSVGTSNVEALVHAGDWVVAVLTDQAHAAYVADQLRLLEHVVGRRRMPERFLWYRCWNFRFDSSS